MNKPEFVRGNQKNYIRLLCDSKNLYGYEYQMCANNELQELLPFQQRVQDGEIYLYYEISGMQSLDILLQSQKLKRSFVFSIAKSIQKMCVECSEYILDIWKVNWNPKYILLQANTGELRFLYDFGRDTSGDYAQKELETFLEVCVEHLDYQDDALTANMFRMYEGLLDQKEKFVLADEMSKLLEALGPNPAELGCDIISDSVVAEDIFEEKECTGGVVTVPKQSKVFRGERRRLKVGLIVLFLLDVVLLIIWKPLTLLKLFFCTSFGSILLWLNVYVRKKEKKQYLDIQKQEESLCMEAYEEFAGQHFLTNETCMITLEENNGALYNLQRGEPQCICISGTGTIIGKDAVRAQIQLLHDSISRVHALVYREGNQCFLEDLNSTNGTWVNGNGLTPREPYVLQAGDKVRFAEMEYIFR